MSWEEDWTKDFRRPEENKEEPAQADTAAQAETTTQTETAAQPETVAHTETVVQPETTIQPVSQIQQPSQIQQTAGMQQNVQTGPAPQMQQSTPVQPQPQYRAPQPQIYPTWQNGNMQQQAQQVNMQGQNVQQTAQSSQQTAQRTQQTPPVPPVMKQKKKKEKKEKKTSFGKTLLKVIAIAACFGIVAGCLFEGAVYFMGKGLGLNTAETIEEAAGIAEEKEMIPAVNEEPQQAAAQAVSHTDKLTVITSDVSDVVEKAMPALVAVTNISLVEYNTFWGQSGVYENEYAGSGIIVDKDDDYLYIATNNHVVEDNNSITVQFVDGESAAAEVRGMNPERDIAVVEVELDSLKPETKEAICVAELGDSTALKVGDPAIAIGNSLGYGQTVTAGVISALDREASAYDNNGEMITNTCIQTDAVINPGNSGGALLNVAGEVVGINEIKYSNTEIEAMSYAIPMATAEPIIRSIIDQEPLENTGKAFLGIEGIDVTEDISQHYNMPTGVYVAKLPENSPAGEAGLYVGDIIVGIDGSTIRTNEDLQKVLAAYAPEDTVTVKVMRTEHGIYTEQEIKVVLGVRTD